MAQQDVIKVHLDKFIQQLRSHAIGPAQSKITKGKPGVVNVVQWLNCLMFDTIGDLAFGSSFGSLEVGAHRYIDVIFSLIKAGNYFRAARRFLSPLKELLMISWIPRKLLEDRKFQHEMSNAKVQERLEGGTERSDFSNGNLQSLVGGRRLTVPSILHPARKR
jgi:hypothetical protein